MTISASTTAPRALSPTIRSAFDQYQGRPDVNSILQFMQRQNVAATLYDAQLANRELALALNRNIGITSESVGPDYSLRGSIGNNLLLGRDWEVGFSVGASYGTDWRWRRTRTANFGLPDEQNGVAEESTRSVNIAGTVNFGLNFLHDHEIETTSLFLRNTDDETEIFDFFNENRLKSGGRGFRDYRLQFEEREMVTHQIKGTHRLGAATIERLGAFGKPFGLLPEETEIRWFYSDSEADTDIPNQVEIASETVTDPVTGAVISESVRLGSSAADFRFTRLDDRVEHYGWSGMLPLEFGASYVELSGGWDHARKSRTYRQTQISLGFLNVADPSVLTGSLGEVFSDANLLADAPDPSSPVAGARVFLNNAEFDRRGTNSNSYLAAMMTDAVWGQVDWTIDDTWRIAAGARWEDYKQVAVDWNPYGYSAGDPQVTTDPDALRDSTFLDDKVYPSVAFTYMGDWWAETFQLRLGYSETAVRPDLREITDSAYIDPITGELVRGNPGVVPADVQNLDLRAEWYFGNGDNLTITLFDKQIDKPIEFFEIPASDTTIAREIVQCRERFGDRHRGRVPEGTGVSRLPVRHAVRAKQPDVAGLRTRCRPACRQPDQPGAQVVRCFGLCRQPDDRFRLTGCQAHGLTDLQRVRRAFVRGRQAGLPRWIRTAVSLAGFHLLLVSDRTHDVESQGTERARRIGDDRARRRRNVRGASGHDVFLEFFLATLIPPKVPPTPG